MIIDGNAIKLGSLVDLTGKESKTTGSGFSILKRYSEMLGFRSYGKRLRINNRGTKRLGNNLPVWFLQRTSIVAMRYVAILCDQNVLVKVCSKSGDQKKWGQR